MCLVKMRAWRDVLLDVGAKDQLPWSEQELIKMQNPGPHPRPAGSECGLDGDARMMGRHADLCRAAGSPGRMVSSYRTCCRDHITEAGPGGGGGGREFKQSRCPVSKGLANSHPTCFF